jgi:hypothetical protein
MKLDAEKPILSISECCNITVSCPGKIDQAITQCLDGVSVTHPDRLLFWRAIEKISLTQDLERPLARL